jgi:hypothetical protein
MNDEIIEEFLEVECDDYTRDLILRTLDEIPPHSTREIALNAFNALIDTQTQDACHSHSRLIRNLGKIEVLDRDRHERR